MSGSWGVHLSHLPNEGSRLQPIRWISSTLGWKGEGPSSTQHLDGSCWKASDLHSAEVCPKIFNDPFFEFNHALAESNKRTAESEDPQIFNWPLQPIFSRIRKLRSCSWKSPAGFQRNAKAADPLIRDLGWTRQTRNTLSGELSSKIILTELYDA